MSTMLNESILSRHLPLIRERIATLSDEEREEFEAEMAVTPAEHFAFQNAQARAHAAGRIPTETAQLIYAALGEVGSTKNGGWASDTDLATKVVVMMAMPSLLGR